MKHDFSGYLVTSTEAPAETSRSGVLARLYWGLFFWTPFRRALELLNRLPVGERSVTLGPDRLYAQSFDRYVAALAWKFGWMARRESRLLRREVRSGMTAVDVGANVGFHTLALARLVGPSGRVHALEPDPANVALLARSVKYGGHENVRVHAMAASDATGPVTLYCSNSNRGDNRLLPLVGSRAVTVDAVPLDTLLETEPRVDFIKIDVQGAEVPVLRGLSSTLLRNPELRLMCEIYPHGVRRGGSDADELFAITRAAGLIPHRIRSDGSSELLTEQAAWDLAEADIFATLVFLKPEAR